MKYKDRVNATIFGVAIGDTLGYQVEFDANVTPSNPKVTTFPKGAKFSDDTQMTVAVLQGLLRARRHFGDSIVDTGEEIAEEFIAWARSPENNRAPGGACMMGCRNLAEGVPWDLAGKLNGGGCGTAMRSAPYGLWWPNDWKKAAEHAAQHALMTHRLPMAQAAAAAVAAGVSVACTGADKGRIANVMIAAAERYDLLTGEMLRDAVTWAQASCSDDESACTCGMPSPDEVLDRWRGWAGHEAVAASLYCFMRENTFEEAVLLAVNSPGDSDSLGAITGAIAGAHYGPDAIPGEWIADVEDSIMLKTLCSRLVLAERDKTHDEAVSST